MSNTTEVYDTGWQVVTQATNSKRKLSPNKEKNVEKTMRLDREETSENQFHLLTPDEPMEANHSAASSSKPQPELIKPPPIYIAHVANINKMILRFKTQIAYSEFSYKAMNDGQIRVMTTTSIAYRELVKLLNNDKIVYHSYQLKENKAYRVVIKNLHSSTPIEEIKIDLLEHGYEARNISNIRRRIDKNQLPIFFVNLEPDENNKSIYDLKYLFNAAIKVEPPRKTSDIVQCYRCQEFGHTKNYCKKPFACVKCGLSHSTTECSKSKEESPRYINIKGARFTVSS